MSEDRAVPLQPDDTFDPIVESLLRWPVGSPQFAEALAVAGAAEIEEAHRQSTRPLPRSRTARTTLTVALANQATESPSVCASVPE